MDILTQAVLGSALAQSVANKPQLRLATWVGLLAGLLADADVLIFSGSDPLLTLEYHRHFSHSVFFIPFGALLAAGLMWPFFKKKLRFKSLYLYSLAGYSLSGFIDACTSYGTYLFWPFLDQRVSFNIISIVDPIFTLILLLLVFLAWKKTRPQFAQLALVLAGMYLLLGLIQQQRVDDFIHQVVQQRQHQPEQVVVKPSFANILLWRTVYIAENKIYVDAVRAGAVPTLYPGKSVALFDVNTHATAIKQGSVVYNDIKRFEKFSAGYIALSPVDNKVLGDMRYSMLPTSAEPLWGITWQAENQDQHVSYNFYRVNTPENRNIFKQMLMGQSLR